MSKKPKNMTLIAVALMTAAIGLLIWKTSVDLLPLPEYLTLKASSVRKVQVLDRHNIPLTITYQNRWNIHDYTALHDIPLFLQRVFVVSEDQRFYDHDGVDWKARLHALRQNLAAMRPIRGASTISEQVIRMWHPRPRSIWSRWLEGFEAARLEKRFSKADILEFYLNQVPYAGQRRGVVQAARYYFDRDLDTLSPTEILALAVLVRAPGRMDLRAGTAEIKRPLCNLADRLLQRGVIDKKQSARIKIDEIQIRSSQGSVGAHHFVHHLYRSVPSHYLQTRARLRTTLNAALQSKVQTILDNCLEDLRRRRVDDGAVLVVDHQNQEVLVWVNASAEKEGQPGSWIDAVTTPRQPGSTLKPFLYALALEKGWTAASRIDDVPLAVPVGFGLHTYRNYSRTHYGPLLVRDALGNSLNIPAVRTIQYVGPDSFLNRLHDLGFHSLQQYPDYYGDGLALGNGEVTLLELVQAYCVLAAGGIYHPLKLLVADDFNQGSARRIFSPEITSLIADILSDPNARELEFGAGSLLNLPIQTAVKTGTSSDYRDAWAVGFNHRYCVGVWMGNLNHTVTNGITGARGPALVLRSVFAELNRFQDARPLYLSPRLVKVEVCRDSGLLADGDCPGYSEWFVAGTEPGILKAAEKTPGSFQLQRPTNGLQLAMDPRIPDDQEAFFLTTSAIPQGAKVDWYVDDVLLATTFAGEYLWPLQRGEHTVKAALWLPEAIRPLETPLVRFIVK